MTLMINEIIDIINMAASQVTQNYLNLTTTYEPSGIVRERVFCYELYHQIRLILGKNHKLTLNGEIDKRGHQDFKVEDRKNPDFVFHIPGQHEGHTIILEVQGNIDTEGITKDFRTIRTFISSYQYQAGIFLLYNHKLTELLEVLGDKLEEFINSDYADQIVIITLPQAHNIEQIISLKQLKK